ncbi:hypothetical protein DERP_001421 [Dermatophagoides pteronyssinus]|uniref:Uncharacterized protein n=1 Tax=Dermatophagoides pteronyssinus TaxID=6956 RepID=A0ABQ8JEE1_DERPT|nr:hypothetical protein DERP_001421 [Dermatophagoides pteronyssinus]
MKLSACLIGNCLSDILQQKINKDSHRFQNAILTLTIYILFKLSFHCNTCPPVDLNDNKWKIVHGFKNKNRIEKILCSQWWLINYTKNLLLQIVK